MPRWRCIFKARKKARQHSMTSLKSAEVVLQQTYVGDRTSREKVGEIPPEIDIAWLVAALALGLEYKTTIFQVTKSHKQNWQGPTLKMLIQLAPDDLEKIPDSILT